MDINLISVIIPMYNSESTIIRCLQSVINQQHQNLEIILIDDCSSDNSINIAKNYLNNYNFEFTIIQNLANKGAGESRNLGIIKAKGRYIAFLDSDDFWSENKIKIQLPYLNKYPIVGGNYKVFFKENDKIIKVNLSGEYRYFNFLFDNYLATSSVIIDSFKINKEDLIFKNMVHDDYLLWLNLLKKYNFKIKVLYFISFIYERRKGSLSSGILNKVVSTFNVYRNHKLNIILCVIFTQIKLLNALIKRY